MKTEQITLESIHSRMCRLESRLDKIDSGIDRHNMDNYEALRRVRDSVKYVVVEVDRIKMRLQMFGGNHDDGNL